MPTTQINLHNFLDAVSVDDIEALAGYKLFNGREAILKAYALHSIVVRNRDLRWTVAVSPEYPNEWSMMNEIRYIVPGVYHGVGLFGLDILLMRTLARRSYFNV